MVEGAGKALDDFLASGPNMGRGFARIQSYLFRVDPWAEFDDLKQGLTLDGPAHEATNAELVDALDQALEKANRAYALYVNARVALETFEAEAEATEGALRAPAAEQLQKEKAAGERSKAITDADVVAEAARRAPDEWRSLAERRARAKRSVDYLERLADLWKKRSDVLDTLVKTNRR